MVIEVIQELWVEGGGRAVGGAMHVSLSEAWLLHTHHAHDALLEEEVPLMFLRRLGSGVEDECRPDAEDGGLTSSNSMLDSKASTRKTRRG